MKEWFERNGVEADGETSVGLCSSSSSSSSCASASACASACASASASSSANGMSDGAPSREDFEVAFSSSISFIFLILSFSAKSVNGTEDGVSSFTEDMLGVKNDLTAIVG